MSLETDSREINLIIEGQVFKVFKNVLCEHSDYFSAMFSGNYVEENKTDITIDVIDADSMDIILRYINIGLIDLSEFSLETIGTLAMASNFLQITELNKQIEYWLDQQLSTSNWVKIMTLAERASYLKLEQLAGSFGLLHFKDMKPEYIPNLQRLFWYLSHPYLDSQSELDVFKFGYKWIQHSETVVFADILLIILGCLDIDRLSCQDLKEITILMDQCENSMASKVVDCLKMLTDSKVRICSKVISRFERKLREAFSDSVYNEVYNIVFNSTMRKLKYTPVAAVWGYRNNAMVIVPHYLYTFSEERGFEGWLEVADKNTWGWNMTVWGATKLILVCGEYGKGIGRFMNDVKVYDTLRQVWIQHGVKLPSRRHAGIAVLGDSLFIVGGVGSFRVIEDSTIVYDLRRRSFRKVAKFPEAIQGPAICTHYGSIYASGHRHIYKYEDKGDHDAWVTVLETELRPTYLISHQEFIYCSQNYFSTLYRFRPGLDKKLHMVVQFSSAPAGFFNMGDSLLAITRSASRANELKVEEVKGLCGGPEKGCFMHPHHCSCCGIIWADDDSKITINDVAGTCTLVMSMPKIKNIPSRYHQKYVAQFGEITYGMNVVEDTLDSE